MINIKWRENQYIFEIRYVPRHTSLLHVEIFFLTYCWWIQIYGLKNYKENIVVLKIGSTQSMIFCLFSCFFTSVVLSFNLKENVIETQLVLIVVYCFVVFRKKYQIFFVDLLTLFMFWLPQSLLSGRVHVQQH